jgi:hypothetical protein
MIIAARLRHRLPGAGRVSFSARFHVAPDQ